MYVETITEQFVSRRWNNTSVRHVDVFKCDECGSRFTGAHKTRHSTNGALTFCGKVCRRTSRSSGKLAAKRTVTNVERHGVEFASQVSGSGVKMIATRKKNTGAKSPSSRVSSSNASYKKTMLDRHGADHPLRSKVIKEKRKKTVTDRFGCDPLALPENRTHLSEAGQKGYRATAKRVGSWILSKPELMLVEWLKTQFGVDNIVQQQEVEHDGKKWLIDAYVKSNDTYVMLDGVFWHGLDKPYEDLHPNGRKAYDKDREQDQWFVSHGKKLVRITDKEFLASQKSGNFSDIVSKLGG